MGTRMAPSYANLLMASLEKQILNTAPSQLKPLIWKRYIDDIFMIWPHGESSLPNFLHHLNSFHPTIKFQHEKSNKSIQFLDTTVYITPQRSLETTLHIKPTDKGLLLHSSSHHPSSCKMGTIYSQVLRYRRITTDDDKLLQHLRRLHKILLARGYQHSTIQNTFNKIIPFTQKELLHQKKKPAHKTKKSYHLSSPTTPTNQISHACYTKTGTWSRRTQSYHKPSQKNQSQPSPDKPTYETYSYGATLVAQNLPPSPSQTRTTMTSKYNKQWKPRAV